ncbi:hypothetical protein VTO42DRAFT_8353 [Malbranchea cinnamomea]
MASSRLSASLFKRLRCAFLPNAQALGIYRQQAARRIATNNAKLARSPARKPLLCIALGGAAAAGATPQSGTTEQNAKPESLPLAQIDETTKRETTVDESSPMRLRMEKLIKEHQMKIVNEISRVDGKKFIIDTWQRPSGGGGISCVLQDGNVFEKGGVNVSVVYGKLPRPAIERMRADHKSLVGADVDTLDFFAAGLSLVIHPKNPMAPTVHLNYRYFETSDPNDPVNGKKSWWFGGGTDLTPSYLFPDDCVHFHKTIKDVCDKHHPEYYPRFKKWCDEYFYIPHRREARGIGGIFFDDLDEEFLKSLSPPSSSENPQEMLFLFVSEALASFLPAYIPIIERRKDMNYTEAQKDWQQVRRGRYVEFNLMYDRGTSFGLRTPNARVESILMSMPLTAKWVYMDPISGTRMVDETTESSAGSEENDEASTSRERELMNVLRNPREWV